MIAQPGALGDHQRLCRTDSRYQVYLTREQLIDVEQVTSENLGNQKSPVP
jgi:hypothetical protein